MPFDTSTRNRLANFVQDARELVTNEFYQKFKELYGISDAGHITALEKLSHLDEMGRSTASLLRSRIDYLVSTQPQEGKGQAEAVSRLVREQAFTVVNRLAAIRMAEKRGLIPLSVGKGYQSEGFRVYDSVAGKGLGEVYHRYRRYLFCLFDELATDLGVLFSRHSPQSLLFPREKALLALIELLNDRDLDPLWTEDETIGWIYQYYNDESERKRMREESSAPRNSRELAVRNQFFTPRYVVEFLSDNTLGRIWYEMTQGKTALKEQCRYLVRRPSEIFMKPGESVPESACGSEPQAGENISQEELLSRPVHILHRPLKDPREILLLDPACGSMHFGLYAFDLLAVIYGEAWEIAHGPDDTAKSAETFATFISFAASFPDKATFLREVPRLIVENNIHGIDIDPRAVQIAGLSLWLRAQRAWHQAGVKPADRPRITRSNLVCAEPMPGEKELLREFVEQQFPAGERPAFAFLLETVFDRMTLAGEAGSLLRIEEEIRAAIAEAKRLWKAGPKHEQTTLFPEAGARPEQGEMRLDLSGITDEQFWERAEQRIYDALEAYAEQAESGGGFQRRLFADDAAQGFAFIDLCRKRYDVVVMNPPFGDLSVNIVEFVRETYRDENQEFYACFISNAHKLLQSGGRLGVICGRPAFFAESLEKWRTKTVTRFRCVAFIDLGGGVLDAMVETAASCWQRDNDHETSKTQLTDFFRINEQDDKAAALEEVIQDPSSCNRFYRSTDFLQNIPKRTFAYWLPERYVKWFSNLPSLEECGLKVAIGIQTDDDFRFSRLSWEVPREQLLRLDTESLIGDRQDWHNAFARLTGQKRWAIQLKGSESNPFFVDFPMLVNWANNGAELKAFATARFGNAGKRIYNEHRFFFAGFSWSIRTDFFSPHFVPPGTIPTVSRYLAINDSKADQLEMVAALNSSVYEVLVRTRMGKWTQPLYMAGVIEGLPKLPFEKATAELASFSRQAIELLLTQSAGVETSNYFTSLADNVKSHEELFYEVCNGVDKVLIDGGALDAKDATFARAEVNSFNHGKAKVEFAGEDNLPVARLSFVVGCVFGRWDIRYATGERLAPELPDPFAPLPVCPPGMLQGDDGLPLSPEAGRRLRTEGRYPLDVAWDGILVDDPEHPLDLERCVHAALAVLWGDRADALEQEACALLGVPTLREWFRRPAGFFADHLKRYSKSRRQAPIYWPLSTASGSYTLWIYYHRLTDQTLHSAIADFLDPKIRSTEKATDEARSRKRGTEVSELSDLLDELKQFREEIERVIKLPWKPDLNDGVLITACPLWKLFRHGKWQKDLKECWESLSEGEYDWAHLAYSIWPERVKDKCKSDRSLAIAHQLEEVFKKEEQPKKTKKSKKK